MAGRDKKLLTEGVKNSKITPTGWNRGPDGHIQTRRGRLPCPKCGANTIKLLPQTRGVGIVVYCKQCHTESVVDIESTEDH